MERAQGDKWYGRTVSFYDNTSEESESSDDELLKQEEKHAAPERAGLNGCPAGWLGEKPREDRSTPVAMEMHSYPKSPADSSEIVGNHLSWPESESISDKTEEEYEWEEDMVTASRAQSRRFDRSNRIYRGVLETQTQILREEAVTLTAATPRVLTPEKDVLSFNDYAKALVELLVDKTTDLPLTVGVFGERGSGKTSFLQLIQHQLKNATNTDGNDRRKVHYKWRLCGRGIPALLGVGAVVLLLLSIFTMASVGSGIALMYSPSPVDNKAVAINATNPTTIMTNTTKFAIMTTTALSEPEDDLSWIYQWIPLFVLSGVLFMLFLCWFGYYLFTEDYQQTPARDLFDKLHRYLIMVFFWPGGLQFTIDDQARTEYITVTFTAWEHFGCSQLWAGIVTKISDTLEDYFGSFLCRYFAVLQEYFNVKDTGVAGLELETEEKIDSTIDGKVFVVPRRLCRFPKFAALAIYLFLFLYFMCLLIIYSLHFDLTKSVATVWSVPAALIASMAGLMAGFIKMLTSLRTICRPLSWPIQYMQGSSEAVSFEEELGFMHKVKEEVETLNKMLIYMGWLFQKRFRVILFVDDLDRCSQENVAKMLEAIKIMLAKNANNNIVCIVAAGKQHLLDSLESDKIDLGTETGHDFLNHLFDIPFAMPTITKVNGRQLLEHQRQQLHCLSSKKSATNLTNESQLTGNGANITHSSPAKSVGNLDNKKLYQAVLDALEVYSEYLSRNPRSFKRISLICRLAALVAKDSPRVHVRRIVRAVILFDIWPFRSNLLYCFQDNIEAGKHAENLPLVKLTQNANTILSQPIEENMACQPVSYIKRVLAQKDDSDEKFRDLLGDWTVESLRRVIPFTLNRDTALKETIGKALVYITDWRNKQEMM